MEGFFAAHKALKKLKRGIDDLKTDEGKAKRQEKIDDLEAEIEQMKPEVLDILRDGYAKHSAEKWLRGLRTGDLNDFGSIRVHRQFP
ncbi:hypothetical protein P7F88_25470 [Vibrio hannami]|uniref:hypothetical protein n=1 Tax=Vibrio hannami TaxID=2717094 RepID=UPI0024102850|nr:hypothetical protein [Vibrio hannami]MDG3089216.1 hypothetical protein [Vibrio hannami]